jgi:hypothetical protein
VMATTTGATHAALINERLEVEGVAGVVAGPAGGAKGAAPLS